MTPKGGDLELERGEGMIPMVSEFLDLISEEIPRLPPIWSL